MIDIRGQNDLVVSQVFLNLQLLHLSPELLNLFKFVVLHEMDELYPLEQLLIWRVLGLLGSLGVSL